MRIALLGYGKEGRAAERYFGGKFGAEFEILTDFTDAEVAERDFSEFDLVLRSPSVRPHEGWSSLTQYFFENCPCPIIGVTGTKGKGTTCSLIKSLLEALGKKVFLVGNIGVPAIEVLDELTADSVAVYEMSSFQLWDLEISPEVAVVLPIEPDHLNVHRDFDEYVEAKANIARFQDATDFVIYYSKNEFSRRIADISDAEKVAYPNDKYDLVIRENLAIPGRHNRENAEAALRAVAAYLGMTIDELLEKYPDEVARGLHDFKGLPHRLEFLRTLGGVDYYDDNFATNPASTKVALEAFPERKVVLILGGRDKTGGEDYLEVVSLLKSPNVVRAILMGESGHDITAKYPELPNTEVVESLAEAVIAAKTYADDIEEGGLVLMSPAAASFDMFENVYDRGKQYQKIVKALS